ncbi:amylo-alpha-1,6-glucosidase [Aporhodopirellula aestuarii]|uniref:Amylo-alpha-1,6-glucosidase n=1 Tax=Aporhodopirellula aestuarii TaxID=2950107 RepID=A0ABT0UA40_9BACT|nr:amylo-alpha-1,6-glucosidase [Aporhodopirellula aestuarii]MCM2373682.1 amylo-alpha-1,6-glucosidase [Aporhodopirellula aestuarii]
MSTTSPAKVETGTTDWDIQSQTNRAPADIQVVKQGDTFAIFDKFGEIGTTGDCEQGLYHLGTRFLSNWEMLINDRHPLLLNSTMKEDNSSFVVQMTTPELPQTNHDLPQGTLHVFRSMLLDGGAFYEHLRLKNYSRFPIELNIEYRYLADFHDIFEVRGERRAKRGDMLDAEVDSSSVKLAYRGLDEQLRHVCVRFEGEIDTIDSTRCVLKVRLDGGAETTLHATAECRTEKPGHVKKPVSPPRNHAEAVVGWNNRIRETESERTEIFTSNEEFNGWLNRSNADLDMLISDTLYGRYPYAGVPWFATPFGRDGIITAMETLWVRPKLSRGVLSFLAATQATEVDPLAEAEPGKIIHEMRDGEMAALGEVPFRRYYGTVDATPLFVILAGQYYRRTNDREFIELIWHNIRRAVDWIDEYGDVDGDGFVEYESHNDRGLTHQCWKDSNDSIFHSDGRDATGAIAVSEVQGYVYQAKLLAAELAEVMNDPAWANELRSQAGKLKQKFNEAFWVNSIGTYAIALDGDKTPCEVRNSNAGHLLLSGIVDESHAASVAATLTDARAFNGWGIRTISEGEARFNPMSYHNGSVWPHDTAMCAAGLARYGFRDECARVIAGLFDASLFNDLHRLPELFCGFDRLPGHAPTLYPVACSPQAWATGAVFLLLQSILGLTFTPTKPQIQFENPRLPSFLNWVRIRNLRIGDGVVDLAFHSHRRDVGMNVERKEGDVQIVVMG